MTNRIGRVQREVLELEHGSKKSFLRTKKSKIRAFYRAAKSLDRNPVSYTVGRYTYVLLDSKDVIK